MGVGRDGTEREQLITPEIDGWILPSPKCDQKALFMEFW